MTGVKTSERKGDTFSIRALRITERQKEIVIHSLKVQLSLVDEMTHVLYMRLSLPYEPTPAETAILLGF